MNATDLVFDALVDDAIEILVDRALTTVATPGNVHAWRDRTRRSLRDEHGRKAFALLAADVEHSGTVTVTARMLANLLDPVPPPPAVPAQAPNTYELAEQRRRERNADAPDGWLDPEALDRCLTDARATLTAAKAAHAAKEAAAKAAKTNPAAGGTV